jgi:hypothetical protein
MILVIVFYDFRARETALVFMWSIFALLIRQTNIFWTAIYLSGLEIVRNLKQGQSGAGRDFSNVIQESWDDAHIYDPLLDEASFEGMSINPCIKN